MKRNLVIPFEVVGDDVGLDAAREQMKAQIDALSDAEIKRHLGQAKEETFFFHIHSTGSRKDGDPFEVLGPDSLRVGLEELRKLPEHERRSFAYKAAHAVNEYPVIYSHWVREDLVEDEPVLAILKSDDGKFEERIDIRPWLATIDKDKIVEMLEDDFNDGYDRDAIYYTLEAMGEPVAVHLGSYLENVPRQPFSDDPNGFEVEVDDLDAVREWAIRERPDIGWALINGASPS